MPTFIIPILVAVSVAMIVYALMPSRKEEEERVKRRITGKKGIDEITDLRRLPRR